MSFASSLFQTNLLKSNVEFSQRIVLCTANLVIFVGTIRYTIAAKSVVH